MEGVFPFVESLDDIGPFATSVGDLKLSFEVLRGAPVSLPSAASLRVGRLGGWFAENLVTDLVAGLDALDHALGGLPLVLLPEAESARSAAFVLTAMEGGAAHIESLRRSPLAYDPAVRDRLIAGALLPGPLLREMQAFRALFVERVSALFERFDVLLAPAVSCPAPRIDDPYIEFRAGRVPARSHLGMLTQPLSFAGLPVIAAPLPRGGLPLGVQLVGAPDGEPAIFSLAQELERRGLVGRPCSSPESTMRPGEST
jgi:aspartyl-tRNA(Asn)/glutamyl-tRNA(Gln) amidotransferase subunit A